MDTTQLSRTPERTHDPRHLTFEDEKFSDVYLEAHELLRLHWQEIAPYKDILTLNPNTEYYRSAEKAGALHIITARMDGRLIGYIAMLLAPHLHYKHVLVATDDIHFLHKDFRKGSIGTRLFLAAEKIMRELGAKIMVLRTKASHNHGVLFERIGYTPLDIVYCKRLET